MILGIVDRVQIMDDISDDPKIVRRRAEVTGVVRRRLNMRRRTLQRILSRQARKKEVAASGV